MIIEISKCEGINCPVKEHCLRFVSKSEKVLKTVPFNHENTKCDFFFKIEKNENNTEKKEQEQK
jgi:hypothetical protein